MKKGEQGIPILAPIKVKQKSEDEDDEGVVRTFFKVVYVFDISQTEGEELPALDVWKSPEYRPQLHQALTCYANDFGLTVENKNIGAAQGALTKNKKILMNNSAGTKTLVHEIAHFLADHLESKISHKQRELETEATAYVVCRHFGFENLKSPNYLYLTGLNSDDLKASLTKISELSQQLIDQIDESIH